MKIGCICRDPRRLNELVPILLCKGYSLDSRLCSHRLTVKDFMRAYGGYVAQEVNKVRRAAVADKLNRVYVRRGRQMRCFEDNIRRPRKFISRVCRDKPLDAGSRRQGDDNGG